MTLLAIYTKPPRGYGLPDLWIVLLAGTVAELKGTRRLECFMCVRLDQRRLTWIRPGEIQWYGKELLY